MAILRDEGTLETMTRADDQPTPATIRERRLAGRRILVTGASSGIGEATARALAAAGARVAVLARRVAPLEALAVELGGVAVVADITDDEAAVAAVDEAAAGLGGLDALVNSAGLMQPGPVGDTDPASWRATFDLNVIALLVVTKAAIPHLADGDEPAIVNISSMSGRRVPGPDGGVYAASKFAVHALGESLRQELGPRGIRVTTVAPGFVRTPIFDRAEGDDDEVTAHYRERNATLGLDAARVADAVCHVLAQPAEVTVVELALSPSAQQG